MTEKKQTLGEAALERLANPDEKQSIVDTQKEIDKEYMSEIEKCIQNHKDWDFPFYIVVALEKHKQLENVIRRSFIGRRSLPTGTWDQTVWKYYPSTGDLEFIWVTPDKDTGAFLMAFPEVGKADYE